MRIQVDKPMRIHPDQDPSRTLKSQKVEFDMKNILQVGTLPGTWLYIGNRIIC